MATRLDRQIARRRAQSGTERGRDRSLYNEGRVALAVTLLTDRDNEIQQRIWGREGWILFALTAVGAAGATFSPANARLLIFAPILLLFIGSLWLQHDKRVGHNAGYITEVIEPVLGEYDLKGFETWLNENDPSRSHERRFHFTSMTMRMLFPTLQLFLLAYGTWGWFSKGSPQRGVFTLVSVVGLVGLVMIWLTWFKVRHIRNRIQKQLPDVSIAKG